MITITKTFKWSPNGYDVETIATGEHEALPEEALNIAGELGVLDDPAAKKAEAKAKKEADAKSNKKNQDK